MKLRCPACEDTASHCYYCERALEDHEHHGDEWSEAVCDECNAKLPRADDVPDPRKGLADLLNRRLG